MRKLTMLLFSLLAFVGVVRAENVAKIGDVEYATLQAAFDAVGSKRRHRRSYSFVRILSTLF